MNSNASGVKTFDKKFPIQLSWQWLAIIGFVVMETSWLVPWMESINDAIAAVHPMILLVTSSGIMVMTIVVMRVTYALALQSTPRRILSGIVLILSLISGYNLMIGTRTISSFQGLGSQQVNNLSDFLGTIPAWFWVTIIVVALWYRGMWVSRERIGPFKVFDEFRLGIVMFGLFALSSFVVPLAKTVNPTSMIIIFLFAGLVALVGSRISVLGALRGGTKSPFDRRWLLAITLATLFFVVIAYGAAAVVTGQAALFFGLIAGVFLIIGGILAIPILFFLYLITPAVETVRNILPTPAATPTEGTEVVGGGTTGGAGFVSWTQNAIISPELRTLLVVLGVVAFILFLVFSIRWMVNKSREVDPADESENMLDNKDLLKLLRQILRDRVLETTSAVRETGRLTDQEQAQAAERIRVIYADLLNFSSQLGYPRNASQTPLEFLPGLQRLFPSNHADVVAITQAYQKVRYGQMPETVEDIQRVESAWEQLHKESNRKPGSISPSST